MVLTILSLAGTSSAASYTVNNSSYLTIFTPTGIASEFSLDGANYTFEDGDTFTFMDGVYDDVKIILDKPVTLLANGSVNLIMMAVAILYRF
ncbi:hypothetical protein [Methanobacterium paludis]|uniref:hypothetical protein n=1 Tax=Methanobacterium paludis (strain DSM 25820 / JCM 18151 / SWAN1) TaxID=868131 RepID=UPI00117D7C77|nr:hypothetical protein [Methanobacterium paludis]